MRSMPLLCAAVCLLVAVSHAAPAPATLEAAETPAIAPQNDQEVIEIVNLSGFGQSDRDKRDINMLRQLFPGLAQIFDRLVQEIISQSFRVIGRALLQNGGLGALTGGGGGGGATGGTSTGRVSVSLPTFPPDEDEEDDEEEDTTNTQTNSSDSENNEDNSLSGSESQNSEVRVKFDDQDQDTAASNNGPSPAEEPIADDDADRNKRFLPFGGSGHAGASAGGSGNFLFDIIRNTADSAARAAGTVYRMVAGTESLGLGLTATSTSTKTVAPAAPIAQLVAGAGSGSSSGATEAGDEKANAPGVDVDVGKGADGYTEGVPGPITRLFVIANRGIANLIQDLILRLAQTSERIVNFKARLVTALI